MNYINDWDMKIIKMKIKKNEHTSSDTASTFPLTMRSSSRILSEFLLAALNVAATYFCSSFVRRVHFAANFLLVLPILKVNFIIHIQFYIHLKTLLWLFEKICDMVERCEHKKYTVKIKIINGFHHILSSKCLELKYKLKIDKFYSFLI